MQAHSAGADAKYMLGRRYAEWCTGAPQLEAAVAVAATAQDELGHTRSFYPVLRGFPDDLELYQSGMEEVGWQQRPVTALQVLRKPFKNWAELIAANVVVERALNVLFKAAIDSPYSPLRQRARKILSEEPRHDAHGRGRLERLSMDPRQRADLEVALERVGLEAMAWYGPPDDSVLNALVSAGLISATPDELRVGLQRAVDPLLDSADLRHLPTEVQFGGWVLMAAVSAANHQH